MRVNLSWRDSGQFAPVTQDLAENYDYFLEARLPLLLCDLTLSGPRNVLKMVTSCSMRSMATGCTDTILQAVQKICRGFHEGHRLRGLEVCGSGEMLIWVRDKTAKAFRL